nr:immunoglobulin light chain junction region [Macaca mulatta]
CQQNSDWPQCSF